jgi:DNA-binding MarR family transcriptional regulator
MIDLERRAELNRAIELMYFGHRRLIEEPDRILRHRGLSRVHHRILYFVAREPGITIGALLQRLAVTKQALHGPLGDLVAGKLVRVRRDEADKRVRRLVATSGGERLEDRLSGIQRERLEQIFRAAGDGAEASWRAVMALMAKPGSSRLG